MKGKAIREFREFASASADALGASAPARLPEGAKWSYGSGGVFYLVPVSFVAKDWKVTSRRIRALLDAGRLQGRRQDNGYWEVYYPYRVIDGLRGPALRRHQKRELKTVC